MEIDKEAVVLVNDYSWKSPINIRTRLLFDERYILFQLADRSVSEDWMITGQPHLQVMSSQYPFKVVHNSIKVTEYMTVRESLYCRGFASDYGDDTTFLEYKNGTLISIRDLIIKYKS